MSPKSPENIPTTNTDKVETKGNKLTDSKLLRRASAGALAIGLGLGVAGCADGENINAAPSPSETTISEAPTQSPDPIETIEPTPDVDPSDLDTPEPSGEYYIYEGGWNGEYELTEDLLRIPQGLSVEEYIEAAIDRKYKIIDSIVKSDPYREELLDSDLNGEGFSELKAREVADIIASSTFAPEWRHNAGLTREYDRIIANLPQYRANWYKAWSRDGSDFYHLPDTSAELISESEDGRVISVTQTTRTNFGELFEEEDSDGESGDFIVTTVYIDGYEYISGQEIVG